MINWNHRDSVISEVPTRSPKETNLFLIHRAWQATLQIKRRKTKKIRKREKEKERDNR